MVQLSIIILSYNTKDVTLSCIRSLLDHYKKLFEENKIEIIVVDNASKDNSIEYLKKNVTSKQITYIQNNENYGFSKGANIGAKKAKGTYLLFLNSDTQVLDDGLSKMIEYLDNHQNIGILGAKMKNTDGSTQSSAGKFHELKNILFMLLGIEKLGFIKSSPTEIVSTDWVSGGSMMVKKDLFDKLKGFDEHFFMYVEDMELCYRVKKAGLDVYFYPNVDIVHKGQGSSNRTFAIVHIYKGLLYFYEKHKSKLEYSIVKNLLLTKAYIAITLGSIKKSNYLVDTYRQAIKF